MRTSLNVFTVRALDESIEQVIERIAQAGYDGIQFSGQLGPLGADPAAIATTLAGTNLAVTPPHVDLTALVDDRASVFAAYEPLDVDGAVIPALGQEHFETAAAVDAIAADMNSLVDELAAEGWSLHYHNHVHEYVDLGEETAFDRFVRKTDVGIELDVGWATAAGDDPPARLHDLGNRVDLVHLKDVDAAGEPCEIGEGVVDMAACAAAARDSGATWLIYEHDQPEDPARSIDHGAAFLESLQSRL